MECLLNVLSLHNDAHRRPAVFTINAVLGNPDFRQIRKNGYRYFAHERLFHSYERYRGECLRSIWAEGSDADLIRPQFHAREHLNVGLWLRDLRSGQKEARLAFDHDYYGLITRTSSARQRNYLAAYWPESNGHFKEIQNILRDGLAMFQEIFGYRSRSFVPCNYVFPKDLEAIIAREGVELIQGQRGQLCPSSDGTTTSIRRCYTGKISGFDQIYSIRNVRFEPFEDQLKDWVNDALGEIESAFFWGKPAIICTHRVNYVGGMDLSHRDRNLKLLDELLRKILLNWPDVRFISSDELIDVMAN